jgi:hypothetical protein
MSWASIILMGLRIVSEMMNYLNDRKLIKEGEDKAIAAAALSLLERTAQGKALRDHVKSLTVAEEDDLWDRMSKV